MAASDELVHRSHSASLKRGIIARATASPNDGVHDGKGRKGPMDEKGPRGESDERIRRTKDERAKGAKRTKDERMKGTKD